MHFIVATFALIHAVALVLGETEEGVAASGGTREATPLVKSVVSNLRVPEAVVAGGLLISVVLVVMQAEASRMALGLFSALSLVLLLRRRQVGSYVPPQAYAAGIFLISAAALLDW